MQFPLPLRERARVRGRRKPLNIGVACPTLIPTFCLRGPPSREKEQKTAADRRAQCNSLSPTREREQSFWKLPLLRTLLSLFLFQFLGELIQRGLDIPVPGAVLG